MWTVGVVLHGIGGGIEKGKKEEREKEKEEGRVDGVSGDSSIHSIIKRCLLHSFCNNNNNSSSSFSSSSSSSSSSEKGGRRKDQRRWSDILREMEGENGCNDEDDEDEGGGYQVVLEKIPSPSLSPSYLHITPSDSLSQALTGFLPFDIS